MFTQCRTILAYYIVFCHLLIGDYDIIDTSYVNKETPGFETGWQSSAILFNFGGFWGEKKTK